MTPKSKEVPWSCTAASWHSFGTRQATDFRTCPTIRPLALSFSSTCFSACSLAARRRQTSRPRPPVRHAAALVVTLRSMCESTDAHVLADGYSLAELRAIATRALAGGDDYGRALLREQLRDE